MLNFKAPAARGILINNCYGTMGSRLRLCTEPAAKSRFRQGRNCYSTYLTWLDTVVGSARNLQAGLSPSLNRRRSVCTTARTAGQMEILVWFKSTKGLTVHKGDGASGRPITLTTAMAEEYYDAHSS